MESWGVVGRSRLTVFTSVYVSVIQDWLSRPDAMEYVTGVSVGESLVVTVIVDVSVVTYLVRVYVGGGAYDLEEVVLELRKLMMVIKHSIFDASAEGEGSGASGSCCKAQSSCQYESSTLH
jgi:hypothetical protein